VRFAAKKLTLILPIAVMLTLAPVSASAFEPLGFIVNEVMNAIIDNYNKPKEPVNNAPVSYRAIPEDSKTGTLEPPRNGNQLEISGKDFTLAFNSRIRDESNRIVQTTMIQQEKRICYTLNPQKQVNKIWLLASNEK
jgi:hypothetical protein